MSPQVATSPLTIVTESGQLTTKNTKLPPLRQFTVKRNEITNGLQSMPIVSPTDSLAKWQTRSNSVRPLAVVSPRAEQERFRSQILTNQAALLSNKNQKSSSTPSCLPFPVAHQKAANSQQWSTILQSCRNQSDFLSAALHQLGKDAQS